MNNGVDIHLPDVVIVGAGAAGLTAAIFTARRIPSASIIVLDGAKKIGAKILVSGGGRCNVTNAQVTTADFWGGNSNILRKVLSALPVAQTIDFFRQIGVSLHEEEYGKLFPDTNRAQTVLDALLHEARRVGTRIIADRRVIRVERHERRFHVCTQAGEKFEARCVVLATGGRSLPKTGSDGGGYALAQELGHTIVPTTPALAPLLLDGDFHTTLSGISQDVELTVSAKRPGVVKLTGPMLWTHFGVSGPVAMDASRHWHRALLEGAHPVVTVNFVPKEDFASCERRLLDMAATHPKAKSQTVLSSWLPVRVGEAFLSRLGVPPGSVLAHLSREDRRRIIHALTAWPLPVRDSRGYAYAEATAGGVPLEEIEPFGMASRACPGAFLVGEILDIDGRIGGFNFQWAWSSGCAAARGIERYLMSSDGQTPSSPAERPMV